MDLVRVAVVGEHKDYMELLQRRVGGILKGIAVTTVCHIDKVEKTDAPLLICYAFGEHFNDLRERFQHTGKRVMGAELTLLPAGIRGLRMVPKDMKLGVVAEHRPCANYLLSDVVRSGIMEYKFFIGTFDEMKEMPVDKFVVPEEMAAVVDLKNIKREVILVPRTISPYSAAEIINAALELARTGNA